LQYFARFNKSGFFHLGVRTITACLRKFYASELNFAFALLRETVPA
jgi:hypothetical protein